VDVSYTVDVAYTVDVSYTVDVIPAQAGIQTALSTESHWDGLSVVAGFPPSRE